MRHHILLLISLFFLSLLSVKAQELKSAQDTLIIIEDLQLIGNKVTRDNILLREITFKPGDTIGISAYQGILEQSRENLMNTSLFNFVDVIDSLSSSNGIKRHIVSYKVIERWYIWPLPIFELAERNLNAWWETKDFSKINYGMFLNWENFRGKRENLKILLQFGYDEKLGFSYSVPYIDKKETIGLEFGFNQTKNHEVSYGTVGNRVQRVKLVDDYAHKGYSGYVTLGHRPDIYNTHSVELSYNDHIYADTVYEINPDFYNGNHNRAQYFKINYYFKNDHRDYRTFPLKGYYIDLLVEKTGMGFFRGSDINILSAKINARKYWKLNNRFYYSEGLIARVGSGGEQPYFLNYGVGYGRDFVRGYEYYVVDGQNYFILKGELKFSLVPQQVSTLKFIPTDKFNKIPWAIYLSLYSDGGWVPGEVENENDLQNKWLWGYGMGLNMVTYYDIVFRLEYSFNKMGESGFFIHFMASI